MSKKSDVITEAKMNRLAKAGYKALRAYMQDNDVEALVDRYGLRPPEEGGVESELL